MAPEDIVEEINAGRKDKQWGKYCFAILDVMTTNALPSDDVLYVPRCRRVDDLPFSSVSDHYPESIVWTRKKEKRLKRKGASAEPLVKRPLPEWLFKDDLFSKGLEERVEKWLPVRAHGNDDLVEYTQLVYDLHRNSCISKMSRRYTRNTVSRSSQQCSNIATKISRTQTQRSFP